MSAIDRRRAPRHAMTLIELVVALVLASLLMAGLLQVVGVVTGESNRVRLEQTDHVAAGFLADRLRDDLINARGIAVQANAITMVGFVSPSYVPASVRYEVVANGRRPVLVRRSGDRQELCWVGFGRLVFESIDDADAEAVSAEATGGLPAVPSRFRIAAIDAAGQILFDEVIRHHAN